MKLRTKVYLSVLGVSFIIYIVVFAFVANTTYTTTKKEAEEYALTATRLAALQMKDKLENAISSNRAVAQLLQGMLLDKSFDRNVWHSINRNFIRYNPQVLSAWGVSNSNELDGDDAKRQPGYGTNSSGRFTGGWYWSGGELLEQIGSEEDIQSDYYLQPLQRNKETVIEPYYYSYTESDTDQILMTSVVTPIIANNKTVAFQGIDISLDTLQIVNRKFKLYTTGFGRIVSQAGMLVADKYDSTLNTPLPELNSKREQILQTITSGKELIYKAEDLTGKEMLYVFTPIALGNTGQYWSYSAVIPVSEILEAPKKQMITMTLIALVGLVSLALLLRVVVNSIVEPILKVIDTAKIISEGKLYVNFVTNRKDEIGDLVHSLQNMTHKIREIIGNIIEGADYVTAAAHEISSSAQEMAQGANEQASSSEELAAAMNQMVSNINQNTDNAITTNQIAKVATGGIIEVKDATSQSLLAINEIIEKITIVGEIAEKTDMLAINASIEAARAGSHGKGFAVVALEIRKLAEMSRNAVETIEQLSDNGMNTANRAGFLVNEIVPQIERTSYLVQEIAASSSEQNSGAMQINKALMQLNEITQQNSAASEQLASASEELAGQAESLREAMGYFKLVEEINPNTAAELMLSQLHKLEVSFKELTGKDWNANEPGSIESDNL